MSAIRRLPDHVIDRIAAGEVVERPASAVKELVENALDAGATAIDIAIDQGGKRLIRVADDGRGIAPDDLALAVARHATSKLDGDDPTGIATLGFRGEALASIGAVSDLQVTSRTLDTDSAWSIRVDHGAVSAPRPAARGAGTLIEVRDLFQRVPARLRFLKSDSAETQAVADVVRRLALSHPEVAISLVSGGRILIEAPRGGDLAARARAILGAGFVSDTLKVDAARGPVRLGGLIGLPTVSRASTRDQYVFVNGRPVRDKLIAGALKAGFRDVVPHDRHGACVLFLDIAPAEVDVNVHPAKTEVRFRDGGFVRGFLVSAIRRTVEEAGLRPSQDARDALARAFTTAPPGAPSSGTATSPAHAAVDRGSAATRETLMTAMRPLDPAREPARQPSPSGFTEGAAVAYEAPMAGFDAVTSPAARIDGSADPAPQDMAAERHPLGAARAQVHGTYILAQTGDGLVIVDQHAAHERLVYERLKAGIAAEGVARQALLIPEVVDLPAADAARLLDHADTLSTLGLVVEAFGPGAVVVREVPALLGTFDIAALVRDLAEDIAGQGVAGEAETAAGARLAGRIDHVAATMACYGSVRSGRALRVEEMNALLRDMETTPNAGQCNHGRPTFIQLKLSDIERLFGR